MSESRPKRGSSKDHRRLKALDRRYERLRRKLAKSGYLAHGTVSESYLACGNPRCHCHKDRRHRHGPYVYWSTKVKGRTVSRLLRPAEARLYKEWVGNRRLLDATIAQMLQVSRDVAAVILGGRESFIPGR